MENTFRLAQRVEITNPVPDVDVRYGLYNNKEEAISSIPKKLRSEGLCVGVLESGKVVEYWWRAGVEDNDLVPRDLIDEAYLQSVEDFKESVTSNLNSIDKTLVKNGNAFEQFKTDTTKKITAVNELVKKDKKEFNEFKKDTANEFQRVDGLLEEFTQFKQQIAEESEIAFVFAVCGL